MTLRMLANGLLAGAAITAFTNAHAQDAAPGNEGAERDVVVVVGSTTNFDISADDLQRFQANDLADIFRTVPSVTVGGSVGIAQKIYLRGLEDTLLNVTVDGAPQTGTLFHHIGRVSIDPSLLEEVEVQAGAGEATAGFGAVGGALRFRTRDADDLLTPGQQFGGMARIGYFSNEGYSLSATGYGRLGENWNALASFTHVDRENMDDGDGSEIFGSGAEQNLAFFKLSGDLTDRQSVSVSYERRDEEGELGQRPNWRVLESDILYPIEAQRDTVTANYRYSDGGLVDLELTAYATASEFLQDVYNRWGEYRGEVESIGFDLRNTSRFARHTVTYGAEYRADESFSEYITNPQWGSYTETGDVFGLYVQDHFQATDALLLSFGGRFDSYELDMEHNGQSASSDGFSGNAGLHYELTPDLTFSAGWAQAMRGKEVGDSFTLEASSIDPDLDPERVNNHEIGLVYDNGTWSAGATYYAMTIDDVIQDQLGQGTYYENIGEFESDGIELQLGYRTDVFGADLFFTSYDAELNGHPVEGYEQIGLANSSGDRLSLNLYYMPAPAIELGWHVLHVADLDDIEVLQRSAAIGWIGSTQTIDKPGFTVHDVYLAWTPPAAENIEVNLAVTNLFDEAYREHSTVGDYSDIPGWEMVVGPKEAGRDIRLSVSARF